MGEGKGKQIKVVETENSVEVKAELQQFMLKLLTQR